jgi:hypothetical protein
MVAHSLAFGKDNMLLKLDLFTFSRERVGELATQLYEPDRVFCHAVDCWKVVSFLNRNDTHKSTNGHCQNASTDLL